MNFPDCKIALMTAFCVSFLSSGPGVFAVSNDTCCQTSEALKAPKAPKGMKLISAGTFVMGGVGPEVRKDELPPHKVYVDSFYIDETEVTNSQFKKFVDATGYVTTAERKVDWEQIKMDLPEDTPRPDDSKLQPGALVFKSPEPEADSESSKHRRRHYSQWWNWVSGANWRHPEGPDSSIEGKGDHPVVQVSFWDACAYAKWCGKRLPTEAEWEYAARGGLKEKQFVWGDEEITADRANVWQGHFPDKNTKEDGYLRTAPVRSYKPNGYGLYDMAGNVWEWCSDQYKPSTYLERVIKKSKDFITRNPKGPDTSSDQRHPFVSKLHTLRGGSFLCHRSYCSSYRPSARMSSSPDTGMSHVGFRCVQDVNKEDGI